MNFDRFIFEQVGKAFVFKRIRPYLRYHFSKAGYPEVPYSLFGILFWVTVLITSAIYLFKIYPWLLGLSLNPLEFFFGVFVTWLVIQGIIVAAAIFVIYFVIDLKIHARTAQMEDKLQDYLQFVSENLKGGMSFERALWAAVRPQFGVLSDEMRLAAKKVITGADIEEALIGFTDKYPSQILKRSFQLIVEGAKGGGEIADIIDRVVENLEELKELKGEIRATNLTYVMFIAFVVVVVAPLLFALSFQFLNVLTTFSSRLNSGTTGAGATQGLNGVFNIGKASIDINSFRIFSMCAIAVSAIFAGFIISIIQTGNIRSGLRYIPIFVVVAVSIYIVLSNFGVSLFSGIFS